MQQGRIPCGAAGCKKSNSIHYSIRSRGCLKSFCIVLHWPLLSRLPVRHRCVAFIQHALRGKAALGMTLSSRSIRLLRLQDHSGHAHKESSGLYSISVLRRYLHADDSCKGHLRIYMELLPEGSLTHNRQQISGWTNLQRLQVATGVASALTYLHGLQPAMAHLDVKL